MTTTKKVILFIVEGINDEDALSSIMGNYFNDKTHRFQIVHGDLTTKSGATRSNIKNSVGEQIDHFLQEYPINLSDIEQVVHLVDTDGAFIPNDKVKESSTDKLVYHLDKICANNVQNIIKRNEQKKGNLECLVGCTKIKRCPYMVLYFSRNFEHAMCNCAENLPPYKKTNLALEFDEKYCDNIPEFLNLVYDTTIAPQGDYKETWEFIQKDTNSLKRFSNFYLLFNQFPLDSQA